MKKYQYLYPAIFMKDEEGRYQALFPDLDIYTDGNNLSEAYLYAQALLKAYFAYAEKYEVDYNKPTKLEKLLPKCKQNELVMYVETVVEVEG